jgi:hypothetical protein
MKECMSYPGSNSSLKFPDAVQLQPIGMPARLGGPPPWVVDGLSPSALPDDVKQRLSTDGSRDIHANAWLA